MRWRNAGLDFFLPFVNIMPASEAGTGADRSAAWAVCTSLRSPMATGRRSSPPAERSTLTSPLPQVERTRNSRGQVSLGYRRDGQRIFLLQPEHAAALLAVSDQAEVNMRRRHGPEASGRHTVDDAVAAYLVSADDRQLHPGALPGRPWEAFRRLPAGPTS